jgi:glucoamylase
MKLKKEDFLERTRKILGLPVYLLLFACFSLAQTGAPGGPGQDAQWATAGKQGVGTSANLESKVWLTLAQGVMTEVYYPDVTVANVHQLQFVVFNPTTRKVETEQADATHRISPEDSNLAFFQTNTAKSGEWEIRKNYVTDPERHTVMLSLTFSAKNKDLKLFLYYDPSIDNSGLHDTAWSENGVLYAADKNAATALIADSGFGDSVSNGFLGTSDGLKQLRETGKITNYDRAADGNVVQTAEVKLKLGFDTKEGRWTSAHYFALGFGKTAGEANEAAQGSLARGFVKIWQQSARGWADYIKTLRKVDPKYQTQFNMAAMQLKAHEDKTVRGANIASLTVPWGGGANANENNIGGYHLIWSRDLYQVATAYMALGDKDAAVRALDFLFRVQQKPDGSFPQNSYLDGKPFWGSLQHDEVAYPLILAYQLGRTDKATYENHVKKAADFIVRTGPKTPQERWEEEGGYSPSTIAAEIAGLV